MYPYDIIPGVDLYSVCFALALIASLLALRFIGDRTSLDAKVYNLSLGAGVAAMAGGYAASVVVQSLYDYIKTGVFRLGTGMTFYAGLLGGILVFIAVYFAAGARTCGEENLHIKQFPLLYNIAGCCVPLSHAIGRIGCLCAGCCYGGRTDAWYGVYNAVLGYKTVPIQLFEALFLFALFALNTFRVIKGRRDAHLYYLFAYGAWRFFIEYFRDDDRGATFISWLTPSQLSALLFIVLGFVMLAFYIKGKNGKEKTA